MGLKLAQFFILIWKNLIVSYRNPRQLLCIYIVPLISCFLILIQNYKYSEFTKISKRDYNEMDVIQALAGVPELTNFRIFYSPSDCYHCDNVMAELVKYIHGEVPSVQVSISKEKNSDSLVRKLHNFKASQFFCAITFRDDLGQTKDIVDMKTTLRFPPLFRTKHWNFALQRKIWHWSTNAVLKPRSIRKAEEIVYTGVPPYLEEGLLAMNYALSRSLTKYFFRLSDDFNVHIAKLPKLIMQRFSDTQFQYHSFLDNHRFDVIIAVNFFVGTMFLIQRISNESECLGLEYMKIAGMNIWIYWLSWYISGILILSIIVIMLMVTLTVPFMDVSVVPPVMAYSSVFYLFIFLLVYVSSCTSYCIMISIIFNESHFSTRMGGLLYIITFLPIAIIYEQGPNISGIYMYLASLFFHTPMGLGVKIVVTLEIFDEGLHSGNIGGYATYHNMFTFRFLIFILIFDTLLYWAIGAYVAYVLPKYGIKKSFYFCFTGLKRQLSYAIKKPLLNPDIYEEDNELEPSIQISHMSFPKMIANRKQIENVSLTAYPNMITYILGRRGAGKFPIAKTLVGIQPLFKGDIFVNGLNLKNSLNEIRRFLGYGPNHKGLFPELTASEHIYLYGRMRGLTLFEANKEVKYYTDNLHLSDQRTYLYYNDMALRLLFALAFCGGPQVVILYNITRDMCFKSVKYVWALLPYEKIGRTIIYISDNVEECGMIADRIAILKDGHIECCGSKSFINRFYDIGGYHLIILKLPDCDVDEILNFLQRSVPHCTLLIDGDEFLSILLPDYETVHFSQTLYSLENNMNMLGVDNYSIQRHDFGESQAKNLVYADDVYSRLPLKDIRVHKKEKSRKMYALLKKTVLIGINMWPTLLLTFIIPLLFMLSVILTMPNFHELPPLLMNEQVFIPKPVVLVESSENIMKELYMALQQTLNGRGVEIIHVPLWQMNQYFIKMQHEQKLKSTMNVLYGVQYINDSFVKCFFNGFSYFHSSALCAANVLGLNRFGDITLHPLTTEVLNDYDTLEDLEDKGYRFAIYSTMGLYYVAEFMMDRHAVSELTHYNHFKYMVGMKKVTFWLIAFAVDLCIYVSVTLVIACFIFAFQLHALDTWLDFLGMFLVRVCFGFVLFPINYFMLVLHRKNTHIFLTHILIYTILTFQPISYLDKINKYFSLLSPYCVFAFNAMNLYITKRKFTFCLKYAQSCMGKGLDNLHVILQTHSNTTEPGATYCWYRICKISNNDCCYQNIDRFWLQVKPFQKYAIIAPIILALFIIIEVTAMNKRRTIRKYINVQIRDQHVINEQRKVRSMTADEIKEYSLVIKDLTKWRNNNVIVNGICLTLKKSDCLGIVGHNGAGKTSLLNMITSNSMANYGTAWLENRNISKLNSDDFICGYSPQNVFLCPYITVKQHIEIVALVRGYSKQHIEVLAEQLCNLYNILDVLNVKCYAITEDNKSVLCNILAVIGDPPILIYDEPTTAMDRKSVYQFWRNIQRLKDDEKCIIITSNSISECELVCNKIAILDNGNLIALGTIEELKMKYTNDILLTIKMEVIEQRQFEKKLKIVEQFIFSKYIGVTRLLKCSGQVMYYVPNINLPWSRLFATFEAAIAELPIESYTFEQATLYQAFKLLDGS